MVRIRLTRKLAAVLNGIDVSNLSIGDLIELPDSAARMMIAERWAEPAPGHLTILLPDEQPSHSPRES